MKRIVCLLSLGVIVAGCVEERDAITGTQSIQIDLVSPASGGDINTRLPDTARAVTVNLTALDADAQVDASFDQTIRVYAQFLGTLTPALEDMPLVSIPMSNGMAMNAQITLPDSVLGQTTLWFDNGSGLGPDYEHGAVTGISPTLWYRDPFVADIQTPRDEMAVDALSVTPLTDKQITVDESRYGADGRLVVTSVFAQGYTLSDVSCGPGGAPPCTAAAYDHAMVFTFSAARDEEGRPLEVGDVVRRFNGGVSEFNGLTEIGFPRTFVKDEDHMTLEHDPARLPAPVLFDTSWFGPLSSSTGRINFERNEAGAIEIRGGKVCDVASDPNYATYKQWKLDPAGASGTCGSNTISLITAGTDFTTDPLTLAGRILPRVVGIVRPVNIGSFNVWIVYPRGSSDIDL
jgi:hypothetical protein